MPRPKQTSTYPRTDEFVLLSKLRGSRVWSVASKPLWNIGYSEGLAAKMLEQNVFTEYVEWINSGGVYRVVRRCNVGAYRLE